MFTVEESAVQVDRELTKAARKTKTTLDGQVLLFFENMLVKLRLHNGGSYSVGKRLH